MTDTDLLREAALDIRAKHGPEHPRHEMWSAIATWLEDEAVARDHNGRWHVIAFRAFWPTTRQATVVARAYLDATRVVTEND